MNVDLTGKTFIACGLRGTGKTTLVNSICAEYGARAFVYDPLGEVPAAAAVHSYKPADTYSVAEYDRIMRSIWRRRVYDLIVTDEANRYCPSKPAPLPLSVAEANDEQRHVPVTLGYVCRRPVQLNQDLFELAEWLFIFNLVGKNDVAYLNDISAGLGDAAASLAPHYYLAVDGARRYKVLAPVDPPAGWADHAAALINR